VWEAMFALDQNIWQSCISLETKLCLYDTCIHPIYLYGAETCFQALSSLPNTDDAMLIRLTHWLTGLKVGQLNKH